MLRTVHNTCHLRVLVCIDANDLYEAFKVSHQSYNKIALAGGDVKYFATRITENSPKRKLSNLVTSIANFIRYVNRVQR
jgi:hypothetical protein